MILGYRDKRTRAFGSGKRVMAFSGIQRSAQAKLDRLEYSIRINDQWRICFEWPDGSAGPVNVEIVDYH